MRYSAQEKEREELSHIFSDNGIKFCFLKGYKVSRYYPEPELRFMLDMDVFVEESKIAQAEEIVKERGYVLNTFGDDKDIGYIKKPFLNIEIHKDLKYDYDKGFTYYKGAFERLAQGELPGEMHMTNEDFYVYILSHTAHHFQTSGTGIKNVLDHFILKDKLLPECKANELYAALETVGLTEFSKRMDALSDYWFNGGKCDDDILEMAEYVLLSGVFGNETNNYLSGILRGEYKESRLSYLLHRAFPPLNQMKVRYKILCRFPVLLPTCYATEVTDFVYQCMKKEKKDHCRVDETSYESDKQEFIKRLHNALDYVRECLIAFNINPQKSLPFYVSRDAFEYAFDAANIRVLVFRKSEKGLLVYKYMFTRRGGVTYPDERGVKEFDISSNVAKRKLVLFCEQIDIAYVDKSKGKVDIPFSITNIINVDMRGLDVLVYFKSNISSVEAEIIDYSEADGTIMRNRLLELKG